jgi:GT2 family glycosyltransferase
METYKERIGMNIAVVILNWNGLELLKKFLPSVLKESADIADIYVADNGSTDDSINWLTNNHPEVKIINNKDNLGFAGGYNRALESVNARYFILINSDVEVRPGWIKPVIDHMENNPDVAACQPKILSFSNKDTFEHAGAAGGFIDKYGYPFCRGRVFDSVEKDSGQYDSLTDIFWSSGACMFIRSDIWKKMGGFDADFFAHMEEIDLCWRINSLGYKIRYIPESVVCHLGGGTLNYKSPTKIYYNFRNNLFMLHKNLPQGKYLPTIFLRLLLDGVAGLRFLFTLKPGALWQVLRAHMAYYSNLRSLTIKRKKVRDKSIFYPEKLILKKSIVFEYYLRGKKKFDEIWK